MVAAPSGAQCRHDSNRRSLWRDARDLPGADYVGFTHTTRLHCNKYPLNQFREREKKKINMQVAGTESCSYPNCRIMQDGSVDTVTAGAPYRSLTLYTLTAAEVTDAPFYGFNPQRSAAIRKPDTAVYALT